MACKFFELFRFFRRFPIRNRANNFFPTIFNSFYHFSRCEFLHSSADYWCRAWVALTDRNLPSNTNINHKLSMSRPISSRVLQTRSKPAVITDSSVSYSLTVTLLFCFSLWKIQREDGRKREGHLIVSVGDVARFMTSSTRPIDGVERDRRFGRATISC